LQFLLVSLYELENKDSHRAIGRLAGLNRSMRFDEIRSFFPILLPGVMFAALHHILGRINGGKISAGKFIR
jgi:hypothetical protein